MFSMKAVIFDFDGTIADSLLGVLAVYEELHNHRIPRTSDEVEGFRNKSIFQIGRDIQVPFYKLVWLAMVGRRKFRKYLSKVELYHGMRAMLEQLHTSGKKLYILSTNRSETIREFLRVHQLTEYINEVYGKAYIFNKTPRLKKLLQAQNLKADEAVYVGDELLDVFSAKRAGVRSIAVSWGYNSRDALEMAHPYKLVDTTDELVAAIDG